MTVTVVKIIFSYSGRLKTSIFYENLKSNFLHETNTFSYDKNVTSFENDVNLETVFRQIAFLKFLSAILNPPFRIAEFRNSSKHF